MGLYNISAPIISKHFAEHTIKELDVYYKKVPIYVNNDANSFLHPALYLGFHFGKRW